MNRRDKDVLLAISSRKYLGQRDLAEACGCSLGAINASVKNLLEEGYIDERTQLTPKSAHLLTASAPKRAVLLAAGLGMRQPFNRPQKPKALQQVHSEPLIERLIRQLHQVGIREIYVVVGFAKEQFEYLIDTFGVELIVNSEYAEKNNLHSLTLAKDHLQNCYIVPCDLWCRSNPFCKKELYSWYMVSTAETTESSVRVNRKQELAVVSPLAAGNTMIGISYLLGEDSDVVRTRLCSMDTDRRYKGYFWEETLYEGCKLRIGPRQVDAGEVVEINSFDDLRELNSRSTSIAKREILRILDIPEQEIKSLQVQKRGMTNTTFLFQHHNRNYIIRIPTGQTSILLDRGHEADVYRAIAGCGIADDVIYFDRNTGIKLSRFIADTRPCDPFDPEDVKRCMQKLRQFHNVNITVAHRFDLFEAVEHYASLWDNGTSLYTDYEKTKQQVFSLRSYIDAQEKTCCLTHIDPVAENFLITNSGDIHLIDWEHAAMQDPHLDIAMFCLQALYDRQQVDAAISAYFPEGCTQRVRLKIYCYIAIGGLLWSNWCEQEIRGGTEFGAYSLRQYRYAKEYYQIVQHELTK